MRKRSEKIISRNKKRAQIQMWRYDNILLGHVDPVWINFVIHFIFMKQSQDPKKQKLESLQESVKERLPTTTPSTIEVAKEPTVPKTYTPVEGPMNKQKTYGDWETVKTYAEHINNHDYRH